VLFPSFPFIFVFLPIALAGAFWLARRSGNAPLAWLAGASLAFYAVWSVPFTLLLLASAAFNFVAGNWIASRREEPGAKARLAAAIGANLALLAYFKYANFFLSVAGAPLLTGVILPLGISFFTFTQVAFLVDVHRGLAREYHFTHYLLFVTWFPHLIAGPLLHHAQVMPQFQRPGAFRFDPVNFAAGLSIFTIGLAKKVLVADPLSAFASPVFDLARDGASPRLFESWMGALAYTLQLYFDFSGYSDMAIGMSLMFNVRLPLNFDSPYKAASIVDFWRRWHMTLSAFLRDYLYVPLGGNRKGRTRRYVNLMVTMVLGGLWHGAGWTFVAWGALHGAYLMINHGWRVLLERLGLRGEHAGWRFVGAALTFAAVVVGWVVFRADSLDSAGRLLAGMAGLNGISLPIVSPAVLHDLAASGKAGSIVFEGLAPLTYIDGRQASAVIAAGLFAVWLLPNVREIFDRFSPVWEGARAEGSRRTARPRFLQWSPRTRYAAALGALFCVCVLWMGASRPSEFLYFQF
jgi:D-alanyl-lipoteichoic acid acyltransferase DltB (MBOAT superfamily)